MKSEGDVMALLKVGRFLALVFLAAGTGAAQAATGWAHAQTLTSPAPAVGNEFGAALAMYQNILIVGEPYAAVGGNAQQGRAYIYEFASGSWQLKKTLLFSDNLPNSHYGFAVAASDGVVMIGAPGASPLGESNAGEVEIYERDALGTWTSVATLFGNTNEKFGTAVSVDRDVAIVGAPGGDHVYILERGSPDNWVATVTPLSPSDTGNIAFGSSVAIRRDTNLPGGLLAVVGAPNYSTTTPLIGSAYVFSVHNGIWKQLQALYDSFPPVIGSHFGASVGIIGAQADLIVGQPGQGYVAAIALQPNYTYYEGFKRGSSNTNTQFGASIAVASDDVAPRIMVGSPHLDDDHMNDFGGADIYDTFILNFEADSTVVRFDTGAADNDQFGDAVAIDGNYAAAGVPQHTVATHSAAGVVQIFRVDTIFADNFE
jgi:FG-GAP repeat